MGEGAERDDNNVGIDCCSSISVCIAHLTMNAHRLTSLNSTWSKRSKVGNQSGTVPIASPVSLA